MSRKKREEKIVKTAIDLPESVNSKIEEFARQLGLSRRAYVTMLVHKDVTEKAA